MTTTKTTVRMDDVYDAMRKCFRRALESGRNWHAVTVGTDGIPYVREEAGRCFGESEYFGKGDPYPVTVMGTDGDASVPADEVDAAVDAFEPHDWFIGFVSPDDVVAKLEAAGFEVEG